MNPRKRKAWNKLYDYALNDRKMNIKDAEQFLREAFDHFCRTGELYYITKHHEPPENVDTQRSIPTPEMDYSIAEDLEKFDTTEEIILEVPDFVEEQKEDAEDDKINKPFSTRGRKKVK
jgi:hypothetical protein